MNRAITPRITPVIQSHLMAGPLLNSSLQKHPSHAKCHDEECPDYE
jgi:hypothetical protein